jgi:hypothetical protein
MIRIILFLCMFFAVHAVAFVGGMELFQRSLNNAFLLVAGIALGIWFGCMPEDMVRQLLEFISRVQNDSKRT